ncbi:MAG: EamA family transporter RarD [Clostridiales Family XIII bacterium]|jgi:chloramphenicol-sensitive protein RarD|nr:EamA family transporter RarD [Clostridiales Family XIII bacterium]
MQANNERTRGTAAAFGAYVIWGFLVLYWKLIEDLPSLDIICHRIVWTPAFMLLLFLAFGKWRRVFADELGGLLGKPSQALLLLAASLLISLNWLTYLYAVNHGHVAEASLGYFINPLLNFVLSFIFLRERLSRAGAAACVFALVGVVTVGVQAGVIPWISLTLALTFSVYGLIKVRINLRSYTSLTMETLLMLPPALVYLLGFAEAGFMEYGAKENALVIGAGIATAVPLLLFAEAVPKISYISIGFIQYVSPSITFLLSVFLFREPIPPMKLFGFCFIWVGILIFCFDTVRAAGVRSARIRAERNGG